MEFLLDNTFILLLLVIFAYSCYKLIFEVKRTIIEPEELINNYFLLKRKK